MVIYCILNKINLKRYIGSAVLFKKRKAYHLSLLRQGKHDNNYLQKAWNKYGEENFSFLLLEQNIEQNLLEREQWWIDNTPSQYNICKIAGNCQGRKHSEEARKKISYYNSNFKIYSKETRRKISESKKKKILQYTKDLIFVKEWKSIEEAARSINRVQSSISLCLSGKNKTAGGFIWKLKN